MKISKISIVLETIRKSGIDLSIRQAESIRKSLAAEIPPLDELSPVVTISESLKMGDKIGHEHWMEKHILEELGLDPEITYTPIDPDDVNYMPQEPLKETDLVAYFTAGQENRIYTCPVYSDSNKKLFCHAM